MPMVDVVEMTRVFDFGAYYTKNATMNVVYHQIISSYEQVFIAMYADNVE